MQGHPVEYCADMLHKLWASGESYQRIAAALGCSESYVHKLKVRHNLPNRQRPTREIFQDDPTPEEILKRAAECRARRSAPPVPKEERFSLPRYTWDGFSFRAIG